MPAAQESSAVKPPPAILDRVGAGASLACAIHCVALPFVVTALPFLGLGFLASNPFELGMICFTVSLATVSFCWGSRLHGEWRTLLFVLSALLLFLIGHEVEGQLHWIVMGIGGLALASGHFLNMKLCSSCKQCCCEHPHG